MPSWSRNSHEWYDEEVLETSQAFTPMAVAGLPASWWNYDWWMAGITYSALWLLESWTSGGSPFGPSDPARMTFGIATLLLALGVCLGLFRACKENSERLAQIASVLVAVAMLLAHTFLPNL
jgi:hypothetical protein